MLYALYPWIFRIQRKQRALIWCLIAAAIALNVILLLVVPAYYEKTELAFARIPVFLLGSLTGEAVHRQTHNRGARGLFLGYTAAMLVLYVAGMLSADYGMNLFPAPAANMLNRLGGTGIALPVIAGFCILFERFRLPHFRSAAAFLGGITLEL